MKMKLFVGAAVAALVVPGAALAQSTGTQEFENRDVVVTGQRNNGVDGTKIPDTPKTKVTLTNEFLSREVPGQSVLQTINNLPGVNFTNNDPYGSSGGALTIRGFDASRISLTVDGVPLNDTGNYAIYSNQQVDPELIDQVTVSLGSTDIDSPTASASGSTVNYTTITPTDTFGARVDASIGDFNMMRVFGLVNTGVFTPWGTKAWFSASNENYNVVYSNYGKIKKDAYNFKVYQPIGSRGDHISVALNWNVNRNNYTNDIYYDALPGKSGRFGSGDVTPCTTSTVSGLPGGVSTARAGVADAVTACGTNYVQGYNPSNTGTVRVQSSFHLADKLVFTFDPTFWYTKANGGSTVSVSEATGPNGLLGYLGTYYAGRDLNGDGDVKDLVRYYAPSQTTTHRYLLISSLRWDVSDTQTLRLNYTHDYGHHRQTGELSPLEPNGASSQYFPINDPLLAANGVAIEKRNRFSLAVLDQVSGEYRGEFFDRRLTINAGADAKFFIRDLNQYCFTTSSSGGVNCVAGSSTDVATYAALHPYSFNATTGVVTGYAAPQGRRFTYNRVLPTAGLTYKFGGGMSLYGSFSEGIQVPGTDNLYNSFYYPISVQQGTVPETTYNFDAGLRYTSSKVQAQAGPWYTIFKNRLASSYDPIEQVTVYRNLGTVHKYGVDGSIAYRPVKELSLYAYGSYLKSEILNNILAGACTAAQVTSAANMGTNTTCTSVGQNIYYDTAGKRESGAPVYTFGGRAQVDIHPFEVGLEAKRTGRRYLNDQNENLVLNGRNYGPTAPGYTVVNLDARLGLDWIGLNDKTYFQFNVTNLFDTYYAGTLASTGIANTTDSYTFIAPPRTFMGTLNVQF